MDGDYLVIPFEVGETYENMISESMIGATNYSKEGVTVKLEDMRTFLLDLRNTISNMSSTANIMKETCDDIKLICQDIQSGVTKEAVSI